MVMDSKTAKEYLDKYVENSNLADNYVIEITPNENRISPLELLRVSNGKRTTEDLDYLAKLFICNRTVIFKYIEKDKEPVIVKNIVLTDGADLSMAFIDEPYLYEYLLNMCYALMLKKLTPPSVN